MDVLDSAISFCDRVFGRTATATLRWFLFIPVAFLFAAVVFTFATFAASAAESYFEGSGVVGALLAGVFAGISAVEIGTSIAPSHRNFAAVVLTLCAALLGYLFVQWAHSTRDTGLSIHAVIAACLFTAGALGATIYVFAHKEI